MERKFLVRGIRKQDKSRVIKIDPNVYVPPSSSGTRALSIPPGGKSKDGREDCFGLYRATVSDCWNCPINYECGALMTARGNGKEAKEIT